MTVVGSVHRRNMSWGYASAFTWRGWVSIVGVHYMFSQNLDYCHLCQSCYIKVAFCQNSVLLWTCVILYNIMVPFVKIISWHHSGNQICKKKKNVPPRSEKPEVQFQYDHGYNIDTGIHAYLTRSFWAWGALSPIWRITYRAMLCQKSSYVYTILLSSQTFSV